MKFTILYDNTVAKAGLREDWGFAALVEAHGKRILFDTGAKGEILMDHLETLAVDPDGIDAVVLSHDHWDHTGGLPAFLAKRQAPVYIPDICRDPPGAETVHRLGEPAEIFEGIFSTGELEKVEQSLVVRADRGVAVVVGCSHSGVRNILEAASRVGKPEVLLGGLHGFDDYEVLGDLARICPVHCTRHIPEIRERFPEAFREGGAGRTLEWQD